MNSTDDGMELSIQRIKMNKDKKASIIVGGNILSRGLTIEGLAVTIFVDTNVVNG